MILVETTEGIVQIPLQAQVIVAKGQEKLELPDTTCHVLARGDLILLVRPQHNFFKFPTENQSSTSAHKCRALLHSGCIVTKPMN